MQTLLTRDEQNQISVLQEMSQFHLFLSQIAMITCMYLIVNGKEFQVNPVDANIFQDTAFKPYIVQNKK